MNLDNSGEVVRYYNKTESRLGYEFLLGGTKHFGFYEDGDRPWRWSEAMRKMEDRLAEELALPPQALVLDAGCGKGDVACRLASTYGLRVIGIDILEFNIQEAVRRAATRGLSDAASFRPMNYSDLAFPEGYFDAVYTMETLVHAGDPLSTLKQFYRVLKPGGKVVHFEYSRDPDAVMTRPASDAFRRVNEVAAMPAFQQFTHGRLEGLLRDANFHEVVVQDVTRGMLPMLQCFNRLGWLPYCLARMVGKQDKVINAMSAVEFWRYRQHFRYNIYSAIK